MSIPFLRDDPLPHGEVQDIAPGLRRILCANPGPFTFRGTNTYLIGRGEVAVLDPGPADEAHLAAILRATAGQRITRILVSHTHRDHSPGAAALVAATGAVTFGHGPHVTPPDAGGEGGDHAFRPDIALPDGATVEGDDWRVTALHTPGHCANHLCFALENAAAPGILFSADHVMSWSTTVVSPPDGDMAAYMASSRGSRRGTTGSTCPATARPCPTPRPSSPPWPRTGVRGGEGVPRAAGCASRDGGRARPAGLWAGAGPEAGARRRAQPSRASHQAGCRRGRRARRGCVRGAVGPRFATRRSAGCHCRGRRSSAAPRDPPAAPQASQRIRRASCG